MAEEHTGSEPEVAIYRSVIFGNFLQPLTSAVHALVKRSRESVEWKTNELDLDWILSGILLAVAMFEGALRWTHVNKYPTSTVEGWYLYRDLRRANAALPDVREAFVLRNAIAHGHVWDVPITNSPIDRLKLKLRLGRQDSLWKQYVDMRLGQTTPSGLHVVPTLMNRDDFKHVLEIVVAAMEALIAAELLLPQALSNVAVWPHDGERLTLRELPSRFAV